MPKIAISYRRSDSEAITGRICDRLIAHYGRRAIFRDIDDIPPGIDFRDHINQTLLKTDILLAIIGSQWLGGIRDGTQRIHEEADPVRVELELTMQRDIAIIPVLIGYTRMPSKAELPPSLAEFAFRNAVRVDTGLDFDHHMDRLIRSMDGMVGSKIKPKRPWLRRTFVAASAVALATTGGIAAFVWTRPPLPAPQRRSDVIQAAPLPQSQTSAAAPGSMADVVAAADRGDADAQNELGGKYAAGEDGLTRDDTKAAEFYRKAASQGLAKAETNLGDMYFYGRGGLAQSYPEAMSWYLKAAQQNYPDAQYRLGYMYEKGVGTNTDLNRAVRLYRGAANQGYPEAENLLGVLYATGSDGITRDDTQAIDWYGKAAAQGLAKAQKNLGDMYFFGHGVDRDYNQAIVWYRKAAGQDFAEAQFRLGFMYEKGLGAEQNSQLALEQYKKAARNGSVDAQRALDRPGVH